MTIKEKQCLLYLLGYYVGNIDGEWGTLSGVATKAFQKDVGLEEDGVFGDKTAKAAKHAVCYGLTKKEDPGADWWKNVKHFTRNEFRCPCGKCGGFPVEPKERLVTEVDNMRGAFGRAVIIVPPDGHSGGSGVRCAAYNAKLNGSVSNSRHLLGKAVDFSAPGVPASTIEAYLAKRKAAGGIRYWYKISSGSYHMDIE